MKTMIVLSALGFVLSITMAILNVVQDKWVWMVILFLSALCWVGAGIFNYKTLKLRTHIYRTMKLRRPAW